MRGTTSIYTRSLSDLARLAAKPFIAKVRLELISARFLLSRCFRLFQQNRPIANAALLIVLPKIIFRAAIVDPMIFGRHAVDTDDQAQWKSTDGNRCCRDSR